MVAPGRSSAGPKCYAFDTGFVAFERGWNRIREDDRGVLWEHLVFDALRLRHLDDRIFYWRDKSGREIDFVVRRGRDRVDVFECKINPDKLDPSRVNAFRARYPEGDNYVVSPRAERPYQIRHRERLFTVCTTKDLP